MGTSLGRRVGGALVVVVVGVRLLSCGKERG